VSSFKKSTRTDARFRKTYNQKNKLRKRGGKRRKGKGKKRDLLNGLGLGGKKKNQRAQIKKRTARYGRHSKNSAEGKIKEGRAVTRSEQTLPDLEKRSTEGKNHKAKGGKPTISKGNPRQESKKSIGDTYPGNSRERGAASSRHAEAKRRKTKKERRPQERKKAARLLVL